MECLSINNIFSLIYPLTHYASLIFKIDNKKRKEMQYEDLMKDHEGAMEDMKSLKQDLDLLKQKAENEKKSLKVQTVKIINISVYE